MSQSLRFTKPVAQAALTEELSAELGSALEGVETTQDMEVIVWLRDDATKQQAVLVEQIVAQHDPLSVPKSDGEKRAENSRDAVTELSKVDFAELVAAAEAARDVSEIRALLLDTLKVVYHCAAAQGLVVEKLPETARATKG